jgi:hypothetical protein
VQNIAPAASTTLSGTDFDLRTGETPLNFTGHPRIGITLKWGQTATFAEAAGEDRGGARLVTGLRLWF